MTGPPTQEELQARAQRYGWNDCPMPRQNPAQLPAGVDEGITLSGRRGKVARGVYHAALAEALSDHSGGGRTAEELQGKLGWFKLRYTNNELQQVLDTAARRKVVSAPKRGEYTDATGKVNPVIGNVDTTDKGDKLKPPRGASLTDLGSIGLETTVLMWKGLSSLSTLVKVLVWLPFAGGAIVLVLASHWSGVAAVVLLWWGIVLTLGWRGEWALKQAALAWPRLQHYRPRRWDFETHPWRHWFFPLVEWLVAALAAGALLLGLEVKPAWSWLGWTGDDWAALAGFTAALLAVAGIIANDQFIRPLHDAWLAEASDVNGWRKPPPGRPKLRAPDGIVEWAPKLPVLSAGAQPATGPAVDLEADEDALAPPFDGGPGGEL